MLSPSLDFLDKMQLLNVRTTFVPIPPYVDINPDPVDLYDKITASGHIWNTILRTGKLNATVVATERIGECRCIDDQTNCTGIFQKLFEGSIDFSLYPSSYENYDDRNLFTHLSISSQMTVEQDRVFLSTAQVPEKIADVSPSSILAQFPLTVVTLNFMALLFVIRLINLKLKSRNMRIDILDAIVLHTLRWNKSYNSGRRRIIIYAMLLYCFFSHYNYSGQIRSDLIIVEPEQFLTSLEEIVKSNRTPALFGGFALMEEFSRSKDKDKLMLVKRATERGTLFTSMSSEVMMNSASSIANEGNIGIFETSSFAINIRAIVCLPLSMQEDVSSSSTLPKMKVTRFGSTGHSGYMFPRHITFRLKKRIETAISWMVQSGQFHRLDTDPVPQFENTPNMKKEYFVYCLEHLGLKKSL